MSRDLPSLLARLSQTQHGAFTRKQALRAGFTHDAIKSRVQRGTWRRLYTGVYTAVPGTLSRLTWLWAAVLYAGRDAVLSHETAAELHGLIDRPSNLVHISIPSDRRVRTARGLRIHRTERELDPPDAHRDPPHTTIEETVLDLVRMAADLDDACGWVTCAFARELTNEIRLVSALSARRMMRWRTELLDVISAGAAGDHSALEYRYTRDVERAHRLPTASRQVPFADRGGRRGRRDRFYDDYGVVVELDGKLAHRPEDSGRDKARDRAAAAEGLQSLRYDWTDVKEKACATAAEVGRVLRKHGWKGKPQPCSIGCPAGAPY